MSVIDVDVLKYRTYPTTTTKPKVESSKVNTVVEC